MRIRFSSRLVLALLTIASVLAFRYSQRSKLQLAGLEIEKMGGTAFYGWQEPYVINPPVQVSPRPRLIEVPYTTVGPNGKQVTKTRIEKAHRRARRAVATNLCIAQAHTLPRFSVSGFLLGSHDDVNIAAISLPAASVNESNAKTLRRLHGLKIVVLCVDRKYFQAELDETIAVEMGLSKVTVFEPSKPSSVDELERATTVIKRNSPDAELFRRGLLPDAE